MAKAIWSDVDRRMAEAIWSTSPGNDRGMAEAILSDVDRRFGRATWSTSCPVPCKDRSMAGAIWSDVHQCMAEPTWSTSCTVNGGEGPQKQDLRHVLRLLKVLFVIYNLRAAGT
ncbi:hypothetical protein DPMN_055438 [Dreissena polymorpha]|uniref:Uncharacterized protein n=1 Tax=Dreissena polymorpha TaxID=45954 RepID=A0A9D4CQT0_DREPO|nr:hypothetical protein DPMN_055438 [Dreissena polymorpha]